MRCTCGKEGTILLTRRAFPYCKECFSHAIVKRFRAEVGEGPVVVRPRSEDRDAMDAFYREALEELCRESRRTVVEREGGARAGCTEVAAVEAVKYLFGERERLVDVIPSTIGREELERFFKPSPGIGTDPVERDLATLEARYPGSFASVIKSARDRLGDQP